MIINTTLSFVLSFVFGLTFSLITKDMGTGIIIFLVCLFGSTILNKLEETIEQMNEEANKNATSVSADLDESDISVEEFLFKWKPRLKLWSSPTDGHLREVLVYPPDDCGDWKIVIPSDDMFYLFKGADDKTKESVFSFAKIFANG